MVLIFDEPLEGTGGEWKASLFKLTQSNLWVLGRYWRLVKKVRTICARRMTEWWKSISKNECSRPSRSICLLTNPWWRLVGMTDFVSGRVLPGGHRGDPAPVWAILCRIRRRQVGGKRFWQFLKINSNFKKSVQLSEVYLGYLID